MTSKEEYKRIIRQFRSKQAIEASDENVVATIHLMNHHGLDANAALDQSSRSGGDNGIDAWHLTDKGELFVYQSKLTESRATAAHGFGDLGRAREWLEAVLVKGQLEQAPANNHCLFNLYTHLSADRGSVRRINFVLLTPLDVNELEDLEEFETCQTAFVRSKLNAHISEQHNGRLSVRVEEYDLDHAIPTQIKTYSVERIANTRIELRRNAHLDLAYLSLYSLIQLYRERGDVLFDKNVRLSLANNREAKDRLVNPMESTLEDVVTGKLSPAIFAFYHIGVTLAATASGVDDDAILSLEAPSIINGCQSIVISNEFLRRLEQKKAIEAVERFKEIKVIAKIVVGTTNDELKEITNSNNRQNPIENWQLFSNEPVHIEIEAALKDIGVFYERQKGKFDAVMRTADNARYYVSTNGTYVKVVDLAQIVSLARNNVQWAAKPSDVFVNRESHDKCFDKYVVRNPRDIVFAWNLFKALKRGLNKYLDLPTHANSNAPQIFKKPIVRAHVYSLGLLHFYQHPNRQPARTDNSASLHKIANARLVDEVQVFYQKVVAKIRSWYTQESKDLSSEVSKRRMEAYFSALAIELGIDGDGLRPFTERTLDWRDYQSL